MLANGMSNLIDGFIAGEMSAGKFIGAMLQMIPGMIMLAKETGKLVTAIILKIGKRKVEAVVDGKKIVMTYKQAMAHLTLAKAQGVQTATTIALTAAVGALTIKLWPLYIILALIAGIVAVVMTVSKKSADQEDKRTEALIRGAAAAAAAA
jgi:hypothetical protein